MPVHPTRDRGRANLLDWVRGLVGDDDPPVTLHHRLDVWTSGLVAFGLSEDGNRALARMFEQRLVVKRYRAVCVGRPVDRSGELRHYLRKRRIDGIDRMISVRSGGKVAISRYELDAYDVAADTSLVTFELETGRMHQLRVQAAEAGWPILGDEIYGDPVRNRQSGVKGQLLHAGHLAFVDPIRGTPVHASVPPPAVFIRHSPTS